MTAKRTPGPWTFQEKDAYDLGEVVGADGSVVCGFGSYSDHYEQTSGTQPDEADLALMLAAPTLRDELADLIEALGAAMADTTGLAGHAVGPMPWSETSLPALMKRARALLVTTGGGR